MTKILIVDDSAFLRRVLKDYFSKDRFKKSFVGDCVILEAGSKEDAVETFQREQPDLVLLDIVMDLGDRDGIDVLSAIMRSPIPSKVIMMSAIGQERIIQECMTLGSSGYLLKPFDEQQVQSVIEKTLAARLETTPSNASVDIHL